MSSNVQKVVLGIIGVIVAYFVVSWALHLALAVIIKLLPIVIIAGLCYGGYMFYGKKALGGGRRTLP